MAKIKKAQDGEEVIKGSRPGLGVFKTTKKRTTVGGVAKPFSYKTESIDTTGYSKGKPSYILKTQEGTSDKTGLRKVSKSNNKNVSRKDVPSTLKSLQKKKNGGSVKKK
jgi:hypothetical protein